jgi:sulfur-oxidizing protein SoxB
MSKIDRRTFMKLLAASAAAASATPWLTGCSHSALPGISKDFYKVPMMGNARILHMTDVHAQLTPVYFREPNVNIGVGEAHAHLPHIVGRNFLSAVGMHDDSPQSYAYTYLNFDKNAKKYGRMGGYAHIKTLLDMLRKEAGGSENTLTLDGGDLWQGSATSLWTRAMDMVDASNLLGVDIMTAHWEFTYGEEEVLKNVAHFKGDFIGQNIRIKEDALFGDTYPDLVDKYDSTGKRGMFDADNAQAFEPYVMKNVGGSRIAVIGQAFPRTANANPKDFFPDWSFGMREDDLIALIKKINEEEKPDATILLSHNGMDVDLKMASRAPGLNAIFGGHTHDGIPEPIKVKNTSGHDCWVTNAGSNGKFVSVMDLDIKGNKLENMHFQMLPVFSNALPADKSMEAYITKLHSRKYDDKIIESRAPDRFYNKAWVGKTYGSILSEKLAIADRTLYRRGNFTGTWDQVLCNALREEYKADISMSAGVRWGTTTLKGDWITMEDVMTQCSTTYSESYTTEMTGHDVVRIMEQVADNLFAKDPYLQSGGDMVRLGGLDYTIDPSQKLFQRITDVRLDDGTLLERDKTYKVCGWLMVTRVPEGRMLWEIVRDYIVKNKGSDNVLRLPKINRPTIIGAKNDPGVADYKGKLI